MTPTEMLREFHRRYGVPARDDLLEVRDIPMKEWSLRWRLMTEEILEVRDAYCAHDTAGLAKELADLAYVTFGTAVQFGIDLDAVLAEVHRSNMSKGSQGRVLYDTGGKVLKGDDYVPADVRGVLYGEAS